MAYTVRTIGDNIRSRYSITAYCTRYLPTPCERTNSGTELDLEALAAKYGADTDLSEIVSRLRCQLCGSPATTRSSHDGRPSR